MNAREQAGFDRISVSELVLLQAKFILFPQTWKF